MKSLKWIIIGAVCGIAFLGAGYFGFHQPLTSSAANASQLAEAKTFNRISEMENRLLATNFDTRKRDHLIRKQRIEYYLTKAKNFHRHEWYYNRDDALNRAHSILDHHEQMESSAYASL